MTRSRKRGVKRKGRRRVLLQGKQRRSPKFVLGIPAVFRGVSERSNSPTRMILRRAIGVDSTVALKR
eukprot:3454526-Rhodomonas_salina.1